MSAPSFTNLLLRLCTILLVVLGVTVFRYNKLDKYYGKALNNVAYYEELCSKQQDSSRVLLLTIDQLRTSNDSLILHVNRVIDESKVKPKNIKGATAAVAQIVKTDTVKIKEYKDIDFTKEVTFSPLTKVLVSRTDSLLSVKLDIKTTITVLYHEKKEYRRKYKNGFLRLIHFDWKKDRIRRFEIDSSNKDIEITETRVIEILD